jgi:hypothetical protein
MSRWDMCCGEPGLKLSWNLEVGRLEGGEDKVEVLKAISFVFSIAPSLRGLESHSFTPAA